MARPISFLLHHKRNLEILKDEVNNLEEQRNNIEEKVNQAKRHGEVVDNNVEVWLLNADETRQGVGKFIAKKYRKEYILCFNCPNIISRYSLSKEAKKKVAHVKHLTEEGKEINTAFHLREVPQELVFPSSGDYEHFWSRERVFKGIVKAVQNPQVAKVGVYGMGSVGKITLVKEVGKLLKQDGTFDEVIIAVAFPNGSTREIQRQLAGYLNLTLSEESQMEWAAQLRNRLDNGKKTLIILDDVWERPDLYEIGIPIYKGCQVVLTTRNPAMCLGCDIDFKIEVLSRKESWALFKKQIKDYIDSSNQPLPLRKIAWEVCKECHGLPAPIIALGAALKGKDMYAWEDAFVKLQTSRLSEIEGIDPTVFTSLRWSYDRLPKNAKSCFLLCSLFPEDARIPIDNLVRYNMAGWHIDLPNKRDSFSTSPAEESLFRLRSTIDSLKSHCLLLDENYSGDDAIYDENYSEDDSVKLHYFKRRKNYSEDFVKLHNVMRDLAVSIAECEESFLVKHGVSYWPEKATYKHCSVISLMLNGMHELPDRLDCPELHTLRMDCTDNGFQLQVPDNFFRGMENVRVLDLKRVTMSPILPSSLSKLEELRMLCLEGCELGDIATLKDLKHHLEILSLRGSNVEVLPPEVGELTRLRLLDMQDCDRLGMISKGVICNLCCLEELYMPFTIGLWEEITTGIGRDISGVSLDELTSLTRLTTLHICLPVALLPHKFTFENLVRFNISIGKGATNSLHCDSTGVLKLENIHLANTLDGLLGKPERACAPSKSFCHLTMLSVTNCALRYLFSPSSARGLYRLKSLEVEGCMEMEGVIGNEGEEDKPFIIIFPELTGLRLKDLPALISFYPRKEKTAASSESSSAHALFTDKEAFPALKELDISGLPKITDIWDKKLVIKSSMLFKSYPVKDFWKLRTLKIINCSKLVSVAPSVVLLLSSYLEEFHLYSCPNLEVIVDLEKREEATNNTIAPFSKLRHIELGRLPNLKGFCTFSSGEQLVLLTQVAFPKLECLILNKLGKEGLCQLLGACELKLEYLDISLCHEVSTVASPHLFRRLLNVELLKVESCIGVTEFFHFNGLEIEDGQECIERLTQIRMIRLKTLPQLTCLWNKNPHHLLCLQNIEYLIIKDCPLLQNLLTASVAKALRGLKVLYLMSCSKMDKVIATQEGLEDVINDNEIMFPKLEWIILKDLSNLKSFCIGNYNFNLPLLRKVVLKRCPNMQTFTSGSIRMPSISFITRGNDGVVIKDLNKHLQQQDWKREAMIEAYSPEMDGNEDQFEYLEFLKDL